MFDDLTYKQMDGIIEEMMDKDIHLYDLYCALSSEQLRRVLRTVGIKEALRKRSLKVMNSV